MDIADKLKIIANHHSRLLDRYHSLGTAIGRLTAQGCIDAKEHWKNGKYLYLLYAMKSGQRKKKYVGNHPLRVKEARQKLQNFQDRLPLIRTRELVEAELTEIETATDYLLSLCAKSDLSAIFAQAEADHGDKKNSSRRGSTQTLSPMTFNKFGYKNHSLQGKDCPQIFSEQGF